MLGLIRLHAARGERAGEHLVQAMALLVLAGQAGVGRAAAPGAAAQRARHPQEQTRFLDLAVAPQNVTPPAASASGLPGPCASPTP
jgi:hypothetical protein